MGKVLIVIVVLVGRLPLNCGSRCAGIFWQCVFDRRFNVVLLRWRRWNGRKVIALIGNGGVVYRLPMIVCCGPCGVRRSWSHRVTRDITIAAAMIVDGWVMLGAADGRSDVADGAEIPEVFRIAVVLAVGASFSIMQRNGRELRTRRNREPVRGHRTYLHLPPSTSHVVQ